MGFTLLCASRRFGLKDERVYGIRRARCNGSFNDEKGKIRLSMQIKYDIRLFISRVCIHSVIKILN